MKRLITGITVAGLLLALSVLGIVGVAAGSQGTNSLNQLGLFGLNFGAKINHPVVVVSESTFQPGDVVTVSGTNFPANTSIQISLGQPNGEFFVVGSGKTDIDGKLKIDFEVPFVLVNGTTEVNTLMVVQVVTVSKERVEGTSEDIIFHEAQEASEQMQESGPSVAVLTSNNDQVTFKVTGFPADERVKVALLTHNGTSVFVTHTNIRANGRLLKTITIPVNETILANVSQKTLRVEVSSMTTPSIIAISKAFVFINTSLQASGTAAATQVAQSTAVLPNTGVTTTQCTCQSNNGLTNGTATPNGTALPNMSATATVTGTAAIAASQPVTITVTHPTGVSNLTFNVTANGLPANSTVNIFMGSLPSQLVQVGTVNSDANGAVNSQVSLQPSQVKSIQGNWIAVLTTSACPSTLFVSNTFTISAP